MYPDDLSLWDESEEKLIVMIGRFVEVCKGKTRKVKSNKDQDDVVRRWEGLDRDRVKECLKETSWWCGRRIETFQGSRLGLCGDMHVE